jgi:hypothetical protein
MATRAAVGFRAHSGWAAAVALVWLQDAGPQNAGPQDAPAVVTRRRIEMADRGRAGPAQPYHAAIGLEIGEAQRVVGDCAARAARLATVGLRGMIEDLRVLGHEVSGAALLLASGRPLPALEGILASHALIHTAEGELFRGALRAACGECGLPVIAVKERDLFTRAAADLGVSAKQVERQIAEMGKAIGPPWRQDEKFAAAAAWLALGKR